MAPGFNLTPENLTPIALSLDMRATHALRDELVHAMERISAKAAAAAILDVNTGEVIAEASLPDYDPNNPTDALKSNNINRLTVGVYEMGSTFKALSIAMALDSDKVNLNTRIDARGPLHAGRSFIHDYHPEGHPLTVPEVFTYSSNVGTARMALMVGVEGHKAFLRKMGQMDRMRTELPENAEPIVPRNWSLVSTMTIAFGHGLAVAPLQAMMAVGALLNGGYMIMPTFLKRPAEFDKTTHAARRRPETSRVAALHHAAQRRDRHRQKGQYSGLFRRRQDRHGGKGHQRPLQQEQAVHDLHGGRAGRQAALSVHDGDGRAAGPARKTAISPPPPIIPAYVTGRLIERVSPLLGLEPRLDLPTQPVPAAGAHGLRLRQHAQPIPARESIDAPRRPASRSARSVSRALEVSGVTADSRAVAPGFVFFAVAGAKADGLEFRASGARRRRRRHRR